MCLPGLMYPAACLVSVFDGDEFQLCCVSPLRSAHRTAAGRRIAVVIQELARRLPPLPPLTTNRLQMHGQPAKRDGGLGGAILK